MEKNITVVTGAANGMGLATANIMGKYGPVLLVDYEEQSLPKVAEQLRLQNIESQWIGCDVGDRDQVAKTVEVAKSMGKIQNVIHCAGLSCTQTDTVMPREEGAHKIIRTNAVGTVNILEEYLPALESGASVVCISSSSAYGPMPFPYQKEVAQAFEAVWSDAETLESTLYMMADSSPAGPEWFTGVAYQLSKCFVRHLVQMNAMRFGRKGIRLNSIAPGRILTRMHQAMLDQDPTARESDMAGTPLERYGGAYEIAQTAEFLCSPNAAFIHGTDILVDGGFNAVWAGATQI